MRFFWVYSTNKLVNKNFKAPLNTPERLWWVHSIGGRTWSNRSADTPRVSVLLPILMVLLVAQQRTRTTVLDGLTSNEDARRIIQLETKTFSMLSPRASLTVVQSSANSVASASRAAFSSSSVSSSSRPSFKTHTSFLLSNSLSWLMVYLLKNTRTNPFLFYSLFYYLFLYTIFLILSFVLYLHIHFIQYHFRLT